MPALSSTSVIVTCVSFLSVINLLQRAMPSTAVTLLVVDIGTELCRMHCQRNVSIANHAHSCDYLAQ